MNGPNEVGPYHVVILALLCATIVALAVIFAR